MSDKQPNTVRKRRRGLRVLLLVLLLLLAALAAVGLWQKNNLQALHHFTQYSQEELESKLEENNEVVQSAMEAVSELPLRTVSEEEKQALRDGTLTQEQLIEQLIGGTDAPETEVAAPPEPIRPETAEPPAQPETPPAPTPEPEAKPETKPETKPAVQPEPKPEQKPEAKPEVKPETKPEAKPEAKPEPKPEAKPAVKPEKPKPAKPEKPKEDPDYQKKLSQLLASVYVLREEYLMKLDQMQAAAEKDVKALPPEKRTAAGVAKLMRSYITKATALEKECDGKMDDVLKKMKKLLRENNGDMSLPETVAYTYANEKSLKKAWYMSELSRRGLI